MFQTIDGIECFVVDLKEFPPPMPITAEGTPSLVLYAQALTAAIRSGIVKGPGKYAINITDSGKNYNIFHVD